jgi:Holliday junction resolvase RusA-like endonuclease
MKRDAKYDGLEIELWVPGAAVAKGRPRATSFGGKVRTYTPAKTRNYENLVKLEAGRVMAGKDLIEGPVSLHVTAHLQVPQSWSKKKQSSALSGELLPTSRPDVDNYAKAVLDALNEVVFRDDSQVVMLIASKQYSERPGLSIKVAAIQEAESSAGRVFVAGLQ